MQNGEENANADQGAGGDPVVPPVEQPAAQPAVPPVVQPMAQPQINVLADIRNLRTQPFTIPDEQIATGKAWEEWLEGIEREFRFFRITEAQDKKDAIIIYGGREIARLEKSLPDSAGDNVYEITRNKLNEHFTPKKNKHHARYLFLKLKPNANEATTAYAARLREKAQNCEFGGSQEDRILEHLIQTIENKPLIQKAINKKWSLTEFLTEAAQMEDINLQMKEMKTDKSVARIQKQTRRWESKRKPYGSDKHKADKPKTGTDSACTYCGLTGVHEKGKRCPAYGKKCNNCHGMNHFASVCTRSRDTQGRHQKGKKNWKKNQVHKTTERPESTSSDEDYFNHLQKARVKHVKKIGDKKLDNEKLIKVQLEDVEAYVEPDSGADVNILDEHQYKALVHRSAKRLKLEASSTKLHNLQTELEVKGESDVTVRNLTRGIKTRFVILKGHMNSPPLLSRNTLESLGMLQIKPDGSLAEPNELRIRKVEDKKKHGDPEIRRILQKYDNVFQGIGLIYDSRNDREFHARFHMKPEAAPVAQKPRQVPYHLQDPLKKWLIQGMEQDIFEPVPEGEPVTWCSPLVVQPKPKFTSVDKDKLEPHMIRASVDLRVPNQSMERTRIVQAPVVEDFIYKFHDCKVWSKLDMRQGYHQLLLAPESREVATFSTPWGNMRPKRLVFGAKASQDVFDEAMVRIFGDIPRCLNQRDDIMIGGRNLEEHNRTLETVLQRAADFGITFNLEKAEFAKEDIEFYGYRFTKDGLKPSEDKVRAIKDAPRPESKTAVRSFLGMTGYLSKFIPRYASITEPLRVLTHTNTHFVWRKKEKEAFQILKDSISSQDTMTFFDPRRPIVVRTEASYNEGLAAGLFQRTEKGLQPVHFISRTLTETERNYSQTEKDALAIKWAKERFRMYLLGAPKFRIVTAHKPLLPIFNKATAKLTPRVEKWVMSMQDCDYELVYEPGKDEKDPLDFLSRHPLPETEEDNTERVIKHIIEAKHAVVLDKIQAETEKDEILKQIQARIKKGDWEKFKKNPDISPYYSIRDELYTAEGLIFRGEQIVLPTSLKRKTIKIAHQMGHMGVTKTKRMLREKYWFPEMNKMTDQILNQCFPCQVSTKDHRTEPIKTTSIPKKPWDAIAIDFGGPYPDGHYNLVVTDKRTRYPEVERTPSTACKPTTERLKKMFATHGTPRTVDSDNGPPFNSHEFREFAEEEGFRHHRVTPLHARANGQAESFMKMLNKTEEIAELEAGNDYEKKRRIQNMLTAYRSTPHPATGIAPYQAMMNRNVRTKLDHMNVKDRSEQDRRIDENDARYKQAAEDKRNKLPNVKSHNFVVGDYVLIKQNKRNKWSTAYEPAFYIIYRIDGSSIAARRITDGKEIYRDSSHMKLANMLTEESHLQRTDGLDQEDWREEILAETPEETQYEIPENDQGMAPEEDNSRDKETTPETDKPSQSPRKKCDTPKPMSRPQRTRRRPAHFKDFVM